MINELALQTYNDNVFVVCCILVLLCYVPPITYSCLGGRLEERAHLFCGRISKPTAWLKSKPETFANATILRSSSLIQRVLLAICALLLAGAILFRRGLISEVKHSGGNSGVPFAELQRQQAQQPKETVKGLSGNENDEQSAKMPDFVGRLQEQNVKDKEDPSFVSPVIPSSILDSAQEIKITEDTVKVMDWQVFYREAIPFDSSAKSKIDVLLLHGQAFTSQDWLGILTPQTLAAAGHRVVAVDLPGCGKSLGSSVPAKLKPEFVKDLIANLNLSKPIIVSPSMSGTFALPFVFENAESVSGFVPIAPVGTIDFSADQYRELQVPTLIVYGDRDTSLGIVSLSNLKHLPNRFIVKVPSAGHAAYLNQPHLFHNAVFNFLQFLKTSPQNHATARPVPNDAPAEEQTLTRP